MSSKDPKNDDSFEDTSPSPPPRVSVASPSELRNFLNQTLMSPDAKSFDKVGEDDASLEDLDAQAFERLVQDVLGGKIPPTPRTILKPGDILVERFEILNTLGQGGMGAVYRSRDLELGRHVAVKLLHNDSAEKIFRREATSTARLSHANIVTLYDFGVWEQHPFLVLEYLQGETLAARLKRASTLNVDDALTIAQEVTRALVHAHRQGIVHRDLKPANIFIREGSELRDAVKVLDFGLADLDLGRKSLISAFRYSPETLEILMGERVHGGTPAYMAPEQWDHAVTDARVDIWAVGVLLLQMITGQLPQPHANGPIPVEDFPLPPEVVPVIACALAHTPEARFADAAALLKDLQQAEKRLNEPPPEPPIPAEVVEPEAKDSKPHKDPMRKILVVGVLGILVFVGLIITAAVLLVMHWPIK